MHPCGFSSNFPPFVPLADQRDDPDHQLCSQLFHLTESSQASHFSSFESTSISINKALSPTLGDSAKFNTYEASSVLQAPMCQCRLPFASIPFLFPEKFSANLVSLYLVQDSRQSKHSKLHKHAGILQSLARHRNHL